MRKVIPIIVLLFLIPVFTDGQNIQFDHYTTENGLPSNRIYYAYRDSKNFIWICTDMGVARFNGLDFEQFSTLDGLADNDIFNCFEDKWGRIWFAADNGKLSYYLDGKFYNEKNSPWLKIEEPHGFIAHFKQNSKDSSFQLYAAMVRSACYEVYYDSIKRVSYAKELEKLKLRHDWAVHHISHDTIFFRIYTAKGEIKSAYYTKGQIKYIAKEINQASDIIIGTNGKKFLLQVDEKTYDINAKKFLPEIMGKQILFAIYEEEDQQLFGTINGLVIQDQNQQMRLLPNRHITSITKGAFGTYYISTYKNGLYITKSLLRDTKKFLNYPVGAFIGNREEFLWSDPAGNVFQNKDGVDKKIFSFRQIKRPLPGDRIEQLAMSQNDLIIKSEKGFTIHAKRKNPLAPFTIKKILNPISLKKRYFFFKNQLFAAHERHLNHIDLSSYEEENVTNATHGTLRLISTAANDTFGLWTTSSNHFFEIVNRQAIERKHLSGLKIESFDFLQNQMVLLNNDNKLWIVNKFRDAKSFSRIAIKPQIRFKDLKKISSKSILCKDDHDENWLLTIEQGHYLFEELIEPLKQVSFSNLFSDGRSLFLNTENNFLQIDQHHITAQKWQPIVYLKSITRGSYSAKLINQENIHIPFHGEITLNYLGITKYADPIEYQYAIRTNSMDTNWIYTKEPKVTLTANTHKEYNVLFRAKGSNDQYSNIISNTFKVPPPFYLKWWFITIAIVVLITIVVIIILVIKLRKQRRTILLKEQEKKNIRSEFKSLNALMNPHFIFNSLNNIQGFVNRDEKEEANKYLKIFSELVRQNMHNINDDKISLEKEMTLVQNYFLLEKMRFAERFDYEIIIDEEIEMDDVFVPPLSIQPIVENSIKHGILPLENKLGRIQLSIKQVDDDVVEVTIQDNGIGFNKSTNTSGTQTALKNIRKRFSMLSKLHDKEYQFEIKHLGDDLEFKYAVIIRIPLIN